MIQCRNAPDCGYFSFYFPLKTLGRREKKILERTPETQHVFVISPSWINQKARNYKRHSNYYTIPPRRLFSESSS
jgi:hypothetical protein